jgi:hypothetical protein
MCKISGKIKFCTCDQVNTAGHYWEFYAYDRKKNIRLIGELRLPFIVSKETDEFNRHMLTEAINDPLSFDLDLKPKSLDRFLISIKCTGDAEGRLNYGFEFYEGKWQPIIFDTFEWESHHNAISEGAIDIK